MSWNVYSVQYAPHSNNIKSYCGSLHTPISFWHKTMPMAVIKYLDNYCKRWDSFSLTVSHTRQKQNYKNYTSAVYCRNNGKADPAPLLWNTRNIYMRDFVAVLLIIRDDFELWNEFMFLISIFIIYNSVFQRKIAQSVM